ncbi:hypothetical protein PTKIN_Ptkin05aG0136800 [Pterospermum kingtungense]
MADFSFTSEMQIFKQSFSFFDIEPAMESLEQFAGLNQSVIDNSELNSQGFLQFSNDSFFSNQAPGIAGQGSVSVGQQPIVTAKTEFHESKKRKVMDISECSSGNSSVSAQLSESGINRRNNSERGKRRKTNEKEEEKPKEVVHVRARRGQATDSHSLAERVRRGKINERLKCLQDIVPGCYKTMGMAVMLDGIINYVQSLQNQVEVSSI